MSSSNINETYRASPFIWQGQNDTRSMNALIYQGVPFVLGFRSSGKDAGFNTQAYCASPFIWGSLQDTINMNGFVYQATPFVVVSGPPGAMYTYDVLGRLTKVTYTNGTTIAYNYDATGNRTSVITICGPDGC